MQPAGREAHRTAAWIKKVWNTKNWTCWSEWGIKRKSRTFIYWIYYCVYRSASHNRCASISPLLPALNCINCTGSLCGTNTKSVQNDALEIILLSHKLSGLDHGRQCTKEMCAVGHTVRHTVVRCDSHCQYVRHIDGCTLTSRYISDHPSFRSERSPREHAPHRQLEPLLLVQVANRHTQFVRLLALWIVVISTSSDPGKRASETK